MKTKTDRQLRATQANNAPGSTAWLMDPARARKLHRAAYWELNARRNARKQS